MKEIDPNYGSQALRLFVERLEHMQRLEPCPKLEEDDHEHGPGCYSPATVDQTYREQQNRRSSQPVS